MNKMLSKKICILAAAFSAAFLGACSDDESSSSAKSCDHAFLEVVDNDGKTPESLFVSVDGSQVMNTSNGVEIDDVVAGDTIEAVIKAQGFEFFSGKIGFDKNANAKVTLNALAEFEHKGSQSTGFESSKGYSDFKDLSYKSSTEIGQSYLVKFIITDFDTDTPVLHLMNTAEYPLHYDFAKSVLKDKRSLSEFENDVYYTTKKTIVAGTLVYYAALDSMIGLTFFPTDKITAEDVIATHRLVEARLQFLSYGKEKNRLFYMPSGTSAESDVDKLAKDFKASDIPVLKHSDVFGEVDMQILNTGVAYGTLRKFTASELDTAIVSMHDILMLETLPAEIPLVAGAISKDAQTPLSHVNLAAKARKTPNMSFNGNDFPDSLLALCDSLVKYEAKSTSYTITKVSLEEAKKYWESQKREETKLSYDLSETGLPDFEDLEYASAIKVGVKASNLSELHKILPKNSPNGFAIPFYHYDNFMHYAVVTEELCEKSALDCESEGRSEKTCSYVEKLCKAAVEKNDTLVNYIEYLTKDEDFEGDTRIREAALDNVQYMITHIPVDEEFGKTLDEKVYKLFGAADVRMRSSTNSEDLEDFNGAGLYESKKANRKKPSKYPSSVIRDVWSSVWSFRAYEERSLWNINHFTVKMGIAVHQGYENEEANGVIVTQNIADFSVAGIYVNVQKGETSITNPGDNTRPEIFSVIPASEGVQSVVLQYSTLSPDAQILTEEEIADLYKYVEMIQEHCAKLYKKSVDELMLDIEFKVTEGERRLEFKQVRPYIM